MFIPLRLGRWGFFFMRLTVVFACRRHVKMFPLRALRRCVQVKPFHVMRILHLGFDKLSSGCNAFILMLVSCHRPFVSFPDSAGNGIGYQFDQRVG